MVHAQLKSVSLDGSPRIQLLEQTAGNADRKRPVLYVHGATFPTESSVFFKFGGASWADAMNAAGFSVWGVDFAGYGRSEAYAQMAAEKPPAGEPLGRAPDAETQVERAVEAILRSTGAAKISLVAHSWGTMPAARFAGDHSDLVDRLVLFGPIVRREILAATPPLGPWRFLTIEEQRKRFVEDVPQGEPGVLSEADFPAWTKLYLAFDPTSVTRTPPSVKTPNGPAADIMAAWSGTLAYDPTRIKAPTLIVVGEWDSLCKDADVAWLSAALKGASCVKSVKVPKATHLMHLESGRLGLHAATNAFLNEE